MTQREQATTERRFRRYEQRGARALLAGAWGLDYPETAVVARPFALADGVAIVDVSGPLMHHADAFFDCYDAIEERTAAALASSASAVVLRINSPGGDVSGCVETARALRRLALAAEKRIYAFTDACAASAAYALACAASGGLFLTPSACLGSVGVISVASEQSAADRAQGLRYEVITSGARKADGHPNVPLTEEAVAAIQGQVSELAEVFFAHVAESRRMSVKAVRGQEAAMFIGARAVDAGLADGVATFDEVLALAGMVKAPGATVRRAPAPVATRPAPPSPNAKARAICIDALPEEDRAWAAKAPLEAVARKR